MFTPSELAEHRADARSLMGAEHGASTVHVIRRQPRQPVDEETGKQPADWAPAHRHVPTRLIVGRAGEVTIGGVTFEQATGYVDLPDDMQDLRDGDHLDVVAGTWSATTYRVVKAIKGDHLPCRRIPVEEVTRPADWPATWPDEDSP